MTAPRIAALALAALVLAGCPSDIRVPNRPPAASLDGLEEDGEILDVYYWLLDLDADDVNIVISMCDAGGQCVTEPTQAPGGDGVNNLPTNPRRAQLHLFKWRAGCDVTGSAFDTELIITIVPSDLDEGPPAQSQRFVLSELGVEDGCTPSDP